MTLTTRMRMTVPTIIVAAGVSTGVLAQTTQPIRTIPIRQGRKQTPARARTHNPLSRA
jgi:hypothetical protein